MLGVVYLDKTSDCGSDKTGSNPVARPLDPEEAMHIFPKFCDICHIELEELFKCTIIFPTTVVPNSFQVGGQYCQECYVENFGSLSEQFIAEPLSKEE